MDGVALVVLGIFAVIGLSAVGAAAYASLPQLGDSRGYEHEIGRSVSGRGLRLVRVDVPGIASWGRLSSPRSGRWALGDGTPVAGPDLEVRAQRGRGDDRVHHVLREAIVADRHGTERPVYVSVRLVDQKVDQIAFDWPLDRLFDA